MLTKCPFCGSNTGYQKRTVERLTTWIDWDSEPINTTLEVLSGGRQLYCMDCEKIVTKYVKGD